MFVLSELKDVIRIEPWKFNRDTNEVIKTTLNQKYANKIVYNVGLCISLYDVIEVSESFLLPGDGASHTKVCFRLIIFRPFINEILVGKVRSSSPEGVRVSLGFFDNIFILPPSFPHPSRFDSEEQLWIWEYENEEGKNEMVLYEDQSIRFRVIEETFIDVSPNISDGEGGVCESISTDSPYTIHASICESGLGLLSWWGGGE